MNRVFFLRLNVGLFGLLMLAVFLKNSFFDHYVGNSLPLDQLLTTVVTFGLIGLGLKLQFYPENPASRFINEFLIGLLIFILLFQGSVAIQFTPFTTIDSLLVKGDQLIHLNVAHLVNWLQHWPTLKSCLNWVYESLVLELIGVPLFLIWMRRYALLREYYCLLLISATIGYFIYYFFPTLAPATALGGAQFTIGQYATGIKFHEIHQHLPPSTGEGGLISFPSFHVIWAWFLVYLVRCWKPLFIVLSIWNLILVISCVVLGWHYAVDVLGSVAVIVITHWIDRFVINDARYFFRREH